MSQFSETLRQYVERHHSVPPAKCYAFHPAYSVVADFITIDWVHDDEIAESLQLEASEGLLRGITQGDEGLLYLGATADELAELLAPEAGAAPMCRGLYALAQQLISDECDDPLLTKARALIRDTYLPNDSALAIDPADTDTEETAAMFENAFYSSTAPEQAKPKPELKVVERPKQQPKPKHEQWLEMLMADDDAELDRIASTPWLLDNLVPAASFGMVFGPSGAGKSFVALDMAASIATGTNWQHVEVDAGPGIVVYIAAEGGNGLRVRKAAWEQVRGINAPNMVIFPKAIAFDDHREVSIFQQTLAELSRRKGLPIHMVVVDTLNRSMVGEENSATDTAAFVKGTEMMTHALGASVLVVHHSGKDADKGARGSSALRAACDFELSVTKNGLQATVKTTKAKDVEAGAPVICTLDSVTLNGRVDHKGRPLTSLVPRLASFGEQMAASLKLAPREAVLFEVIESMIEAEGSPDGSCAYSAVRDAFKAHPDIASLKSDSIRQAFSRNLSSLCDRGKINRNGDSITMM
ncbi:AAA family ATPase [Cobetia crustatorum]|uniref:AAA family ATPase n=1 Tax=Cobetia crustatorum TaxID=553385 RepID=A0A558HXI9_9GAMM|nr:AAA family ATPase [Cobetia crustatorum]TVU73850.1 AAA family ATPase [Cobetia crustatorum]